MRTQAPNRRVRTRARADRFWLWCRVAIIAATVLAYAPAMRAPFLMDDGPAIAQNETIHTLWPMSIALHPPLNTSVEGRPVVNYSFAVNYAINTWLLADAWPDGPNQTVSFHAVNLGLHVICGLLLFSIVRRTLRTAGTAQRCAARADGIATAVMGLWLLHPIQTEALNYIVQRTEVLVSVCYLAVVYASIRAWDASSERRAIGWRAAAIVALIVGLGSKEVMLTTPLMVVLYDRAFRVDSWKQLLIRRSRLLYYGALAVCWGVAMIMIVGRSRFGTVGFHVGLTWYQYFYSQAWAVLHYLRLAFWPSGLTIDYGQKPVGGWRALQGVVVLGALAAGTVVAWLRGKHWRWLGFLGAWFFLILAPSSSVVPIVTEIAAERRLYLALAGVMVLVVVAACLAWDDIAARFAEPSRQRRLGSFAWGMALSFLLAMAATTYARSDLYARPEALWRDAVRKRPDNARAYVNLAVQVLRSTPPRPAEGESLYTKAIGLDSTALDGWSGLALVKIEEGRPDEAVVLLERVLRINPDYVEGIDRLGKVLVQLGQPDRALPYVKRLADASPTDTRLVQLGDAYLRVGQASEAEAALRKALALNPDRADAAGLLGELLTDQGRGVEAIGILEHAVALDPGWGVNLGLLSVAYAEAGRADDASLAARAATERANGDSLVYALAERAKRIAKQR